QTYYIIYKTGSIVTETQIEIDDKSDTFFTNCTCSSFYQHGSCTHIIALLAKIYEKNDDPSLINNTLNKDFQHSVWYQISKKYNEIYGKNSLPIEITHLKNLNSYQFILSDESNKEIFYFTLTQDEMEWLIRKYGAIKKNPKGSDNSYSLNFSNTLWEIPFFSKNQNLKIKKFYQTSGFSTPQQKYLDSFWFNLGKLWYLNFQHTSQSELIFQMEQKILIIKNDKQKFNFIFPSQDLSTTLNNLFQQKDLWNKISKISETARLDYQIDINPQHELLIKPLLTLSMDAGTDRTIELTEENCGPTCVIGRFFYFPEYGFIPFRHKDFYLDPKYFQMVPTTLPGEAIIDFIDKYKLHLDNDHFYAINPVLKNRHIVKKIKSRRIFYQGYKSGWLYLSIKYGVGSEILSFYEIYQAIKNGKNVIVGTHDWIDLNNEEFRWIGSLNEADISFIKEKDEVIPIAKVSALDYLKINISQPIKVKSYTSDDLKKRIENLDNLKSEEIQPGLEKYQILLRDYQNIGYGWLWFLYQNGLSGLLCDDMGLGKTFQSLALIGGIVQTHQTAKFLIISPYSVVHHWKNKLALIPEIKIYIYHGSDRHLDEWHQEKYAAILTSYGTLRNDIEILGKLSFQLAVFDEVQAVKNRSSLTFVAALQIQAKMRLGLTGTPIENYIIELKAIFDLILPGYLGSDTFFQKKFVETLEKDDNKETREKLRSLVYPFTLRRTKSQVLTELPPKIEEIRTCELSDDQIKLYRDVIDNRSGEIFSALTNLNTQIPYLHIFAILNYLKQICNHPAQLKENQIDYHQYKSGKWDLFCELLEESLNSGLKVVIFSQFLNMLALIEKYLEDNNIQFASIKGSTKNREAMIDKFNNDPNCMVFTASLLAGGLGIDLTGGSVVIHYDRWWNAAREDQATDRVYRIGQKRGVQVFKLVTEGTLEEKIDRIIFKKKNLMEDIITVDEASVMKKFSRDELVELLKWEI
ncbi:DEAD/DEAH box helicase, partial [candidate division KSB1 bacterium]|nr:DEAD/DEAH box helicase [candidate division KSB1 bacterium]